MADLYETLKISFNNNTEKVTSSSDTEDVNSNENIEIIDEQKFYENVKEELHKLLFNVATGKSDAIDLDKIPDIAQKLKAIDEKIETLELTNEEKQILRENAYDIEIGKTLEEEYNQTDIINALDSASVADLIINAASKEGTQEDREIASAVEKNIDSEKLTQTVETARKDQTISRESLYTEIERRNPKIRINKNQAETNLRREVARVLTNRAMNKPETINIVYGKALEGLESKINSVTGEFGARLSGLMLETEQRLQIENEMEQELEKQIEEYINDDKQYEQILEQIEENPDDLASLTTRALNDEGSIQRDYEEKLESKPYEEAIDEELIVDMPETLEELHEFAEKIRSKVAQNNPQTILVPKFGQNIEDGLSQIETIIESETEEDVSIKNPIISNLNLTSPAIEKITKEIKEKHAKGKDARQIIYDKLSPYARRQLMHSSAYVEPTEEGKKEIKRFEEAFVMTSDLRETYAQTAERLGTGTIEEVVANIQKNAFKKSKKQN